MTTFIKESAPHIRRKSSVNRMMLDVIIALLPVVIFSIIVYKVSALMVLGISISVMLISEFVYVGLRNKMPFDGKKHSFKELFEYAYKGKYHLSNVLSPLVSSLIFSMIMPSGATWYAVLIGSLAGIILGKLLFGGLGNNIFNPAAVGMIFSKLCFSSTGQFNVDAGATVLGSLNENFVATIENTRILDMFLGKMGGTLGETCTLLIIVGAIYLLIRRSADFRSMLSYLCSFLIMALISGIVIKYACGTIISVIKYTMFQLFSGGLFFGAVFMITDPVTSPITSPSRMMLGIFAGILTIFIRLFGALPEGVGFSILICNLLAPVLDYGKWSSQKYTWKKMTFITVIFLLFVGIMIWALIANKEGFWYVK